jgi:CelD/BcsL family acetyltransferase involved in cellulose biosynthesis
VSSATAAVITPAPRQAWRRALAADPNAVATQTPEWLDCLCAMRGYLDASRLYEFPDGRTVILPLAAKVRGGVRIAEESWPYGWGYGGGLVAGGPLTRFEAGIVLADLARRPVVVAGMVPMPLTARVWEEAAAPYRAQRVPYLTQVIDLDGGFDAVWCSRYRRQARGNVRRAQRYSLDIRKDRGVSGAEVFAALHPKSVDRWARQRGQPLWLARWLARTRNRAGQVAAVARALGEACVIWSAHRAGEPVAVNVVLQYGWHSMGWLAAMDLELARETRAGYLLQSLAIEDACRVGARYFHMGESDPGSTVEHYKSHFGPWRVEYHALRFERLPVTQAQRGLRAAAQRAVRRPGRGGPA